MTARDELIKAGLLKPSAGRRASRTPQEMIKFECRICWSKHSSPFSLNLHMQLEHGEGS